MRVLSATARKVGSIFSVAVLVLVVGACGQREDPDWSGLPEADAVVGGTLDTLTRKIEDADERSILLAVADVSPLVGREPSYRGGGQWDPDYYVVAACRMNRGNDLKYQVAVVPLGAVTPELKVQVERGDLAEHADCSEF